MPLTTVATCDDGQRMQLDGAPGRFFTSMPPYSIYRPMEISIDPHSAKRIPAELRKAIRAASVEEDEREPDTVRYVFRDDQRSTVLWLCERLKEHGVAFAALTQPWYEPVETRPEEMRFSTIDADVNQSGTSPGRVIRADVRFGKRGGDA